MERLLLVSMTTMNESIIELKYSKHFALFLALDVGEYTYLTTQYFGSAHVGRKCP